MKKSYGFDDVAIVQKKNVCKSRSGVKIESEIVRGIRWSSPLIAANMKSVTNAEFCTKLDSLGALGILHRAFLEKDYLHEVGELAKKCRIVAVSIGISDHDLLAKLVKRGANLITIDIAHAYCDATVDMCKHIRQNYPHVKIIVGNTINVDMLNEIDGLADALKVGCASGCFAAGTRILMANGTYKNIEDIERGDRIINMDGTPVQVKRTWKTGVKQVARYKNNSFYKDTFCTPDHKHWVGDLSSTSQKTIESRGFKPLLDQLSKTIPKQSKYKWLSIDSLDRGVLLFPRKISFEMPDTFTIELQKRCGGNWRTGYKYKTDSVLKPSYELGYIFGLFLGDGHSKTSYNAKRGSHTGSVNWSLGKNEATICSKLDACLWKVFQKRCNISNKRNMLICNLYYKPLADFLEQFGKRQDKHLPTDLLVNNPQYLRGILSGLIDSDGCVSHGRTSFTNTSSRLMELFNIIHFVINNSLPTNGRPQKGISNLIKNPQKAFHATCLVKPNRRITARYQIIKRLDYEKTQQSVDVYDIEIDCPTHSFVANNVIVHNSACETAMTAGCYEPQFSAVFKFRERAKQLGMPIISDGSIKRPADLVKAIGAGASSIMAGQIFARCPESAALTIESDGVKKRIYSGMASRDVQEEWRGHVHNDCPEGKTILLNTGEPVDKLISRYNGALRSGISYGGFDNIEDFQSGCEFLLI